MLIFTSLQFVVHAISAHFDPSYRSPKNDAFGPGAYYEKGTFDLETWTCDLAGKPVKAMGNSYQTQCLVEKASRWILIPMFIFSVAALLPLDLRPATEGSRNGSTKQEEGDELEARHESR